MSARQVAKQLDGQGYPPLKVFPLYSALPTHQQLEAFKPSAPGMRKLILSTNVAETSVTIGGVYQLILITPRFKCDIKHWMKYNCVSTPYIGI